ncbi:MAG: Yip1 family protein [bacterium]
MEMLTFLSFWRLIVFQPKKFFREYFREESSPYLWFTLIIYGLAVEINRIDRQFVKGDLQNKLDQGEFLNNWFSYWTFAIIIGLIIGYCFYRLGGWFFNLRVKWSKGVPNVKTARFINLYSCFLPCFITVFVSIIETLSKPKPYIPDEPLLPTRDLLLAIISILASYYSIYVSYQGVTIVMKPEKWRCRIWFLILPILFFSLIALGTMSMFWVIFSLKG